MDPRNVPTPVIAVYHITIGGLLNDDYLVGVNADEVPLPDKRISGWR